MAMAELEAEPENIWPKRNLSWVLYSQLDNLIADLPAFLVKLNEIKALNLPPDEVMLFDNLSIVIAKAARNISSSTPIDHSKIRLLFDNIKEIPLVRPSKWYSVLFQAMHKAFKEFDDYIEFADWWNLSNLRPEDFEKEKLPNGKEVMALAEQAYIAYAKHLLPKQSFQGNVVFDRNKAEEFLPRLTQIADNYPSFQYPSYFQAKLLLALGDREDMLSALLPFARKKKNDFWVWEILSEAFLNDEEKVFALYCRALSCQSPEEMLVNLRQKMAVLLIKRQQFNEAKTEIDLLVTSKNASGFRIPHIVSEWQSQEWYKNAVALKNNHNLYNQFKSIADGILFADIPEVTVIVEFVNSERKILNFIESESNHGFFKYERFIRNVSIGDTLKVRFQSGTVGGLFFVYTASKVVDEDFRKQYYKEVEGTVRIPEGKTFGFLDSVFIQPSIVTKHKLTNGDFLKAYSIKTFNKEKKQWSWKISEVLLTLQKEENIDIKMLIKKGGDAFKELIIKYISVYFPFTVDQVIRFQDKLCRGSFGTADISINTSMGIYKIGLIFNIKLDWSDQNLLSFFSSGGGFFTILEPITLNEVLLSWPHAVYDDRINSFYAENWNTYEIPKIKMEEYKAELEKSCAAILEKNRSISLGFKTLFDLFVYHSNKGLTNIEILQFPNIWDDLIAKYITRENIDQVLELFNSEFILILNENSDYM